MCDNITIVKFTQLIINKYNQKEEVIQYTRDAREGLFVWESRVLSHYIKEHERVLVLGSGAGREVWGIEKMGVRVYGIEISDEQLRSALKLKGETKSDGYFVRGDAMFLPFKNKIFDSVVMFRQFLQHFPGRNNRVILLNEVLRVLVPGGIIFLSVNLNPYGLGLARILNYIYRKILVPRDYIRKELMDSNVTYNNQGGFFYKLTVNILNWLFYNTKRIYRKLLFFLFSGRKNEMDVNDFLVSQISNAKSGGKIWFHDYSYSEVLEELRACGFTILMIRDIVEIESGINFPELIRRGAKFICVVARKEA